MEVSFELCPDFTSGFREGVLRGLREGVERTTGAAWQAEVGEDRGARRAGAEPLSRARPDEIPAQYDVADCDKLYLLSVESAGGGFRVSGREWDAMTAQLGPVRSRNFFERELVAGRLLELLRGLYRPVAVVEQAKNGPVMLRARGAALAPRDGGWQALRAGALFEVYYRYVSKERVAERIQQVPWTYFSVGSVEQGASECTVTSGLRISFANRRRRIECVALGISREIGATRLTLMTTPPARRPLGGIEVEVFSHSIPSLDDGTATAAEKPERFVTDRNGQIRLVRATQAIDKPIWLLVRSGQLVLARVPFVPGIRADEVLELPDDTLRLEVEGQIAQLQSELVDTVARRAVVVALARQRAKTGEWAAVDGLLNQLATMPRAARFAADLSAVRLNAQKRARDRKDKPAELRIRKLCSETDELIAHYLDDAKVNELREEVAELKRLAAEEAESDKVLKTGGKPNDAATEKSAPPSPAKPAVERPVF